LWFHVKQDVVCLESIHLATVFVNVNLCNPLFKQSGTRWFHAPHLRAVMPTPMQRWQVLVLFIGGSSPHPLQTGQITSLRQRSSALPVPLHVGQALRER